MEPMVGKTIQLQKIKRDILTNIKPWINRKEIIAIMGESKEKIDGKEIQSIPLWKWLLK